MKEEYIIDQSKTERITLSWERTKPTPRTITVRLKKEGANVEIAGMFAGQQEETLPINICIFHDAPHTKSRVVLRGVVKDRASVDIKVTATLAKGACGADAKIDGRALLLSEEAKAELRPYLEIDENEVKATHATFIGPLDEEELFYARSRGLTEEEARSLLIEGFLAPVTVST